MGFPDKTNLKSIGPLYEDPLIRKLLETRLDSFLLVSNIYHEKTARSFL